MASPVPLTSTVVIGAPPVGSNSSIFRVLKLPLQRWPSLSTADAALLPRFGREGRKRCAGGRIAEDRVAVGRVVEVFGGRARGVVDRDVRAAARRARPSAG